MFPFLFVEKYGSIWQTSPFWPLLFVRHLNVPFVRGTIGQNQSFALAIKISHLLWQSKSATCSGNQNQSLSFWGEIDKLNVLLGTKIISLFRPFDVNKYQTNSMFGLTNLVYLGHLCLAGTIQRLDRREKLHLFVSFLMSFLTNFRQTWQSISFVGKIDKLDVLAWKTRHLD
jgi:hypothetical protein